MTIIYLNMYKFNKVCLPFVQCTPFFLNFPILLFQCFFLLLFSQFEMRSGLTLIKINKNSKLLPIYSPRTSYKSIRESDNKLLADLTLNFDRFTIDLLKQEFRRRNWEMNLIQFICVVREHLPSWQVDLVNRNFKLVRCLTLLFKQIDINCNGKLEWDQFTNYVIQKATVLKNLKAKNEQIKSYTKLNLKPKRKFDSPIAKSVYMKQLEKIALFEQGSNTVMFMDINSGQFLAKNLVITPKQLVVNMAVVKKTHQGKIEMKKKDLVIQTQTRVLDLLYISQQKYQILVTSTSDGYVRGWKYNPSGFTLATLPDSEQQIMEHQFPQEIYCLAWDHLNQILFCGQKQGKIYSWNLKTDTQKELNQGEANQQRHTMIVMDMVSMPKLHFMASAGMDCKLILWDTINNKIKWIYKQHTRGILSVTFNQTFILLFSGGFDHQICIWNPYISTLIHKIQGHSSPILTLKIIEGTNQLISLDQQGNVKISDVRRFNIINSFSINNLDETQKFKPNFLTVIPKPLKLCLVGRSISIFQYDKNYNPLSADDFTTINCKYLQDNLSFYTVSGNRIKIWNALTGEIDRILLDFPQTQISVFALDTFKKRMILGDTKGNVTIYNSKNGAKLKALPKHQSQVTHIISCIHNDEEIFITAGADNFIKISKQTTQYFQQIRTLLIKKEAVITSLYYCNQAHIIVVGTNIGLLGFYEIETGKLIGSIVEKQFQQITSITKMQQNRTIVVTHADGAIDVIALPPLINKFQKLYSFAHPDPENIDKQIGIISSVYSPSLKKFFLVDDKGYLTCYDFQIFCSDLQKNFQFQKNHREGNRRMAQRIQRPTALKSDIIWCTKAHNQGIKHLQYVESNQLLITSSYDKRVKIWNAKTGQYIDSFQQNYEKGGLKPLAYRSKNSLEIYNLDFSQKINKQFKQRDMIPNQSQFDPFYEIECIDPNKLSNKHSSDWKLQINFKQHYQKSSAEFNTIAHQVNSTFASLKKQSKTLHTNNHSSTALIKSQLLQKKNILKEFKDKRKQGKHISIYQDFFYEPSKKPNTTTGINTSASSLKKMKSILSMNHLHPSINHQLLKVKSRDDINREIEEHKKYIDDLHHKDIESTILRKDEIKIKLSTEQAKAAAKLSLALLNVDKNDRRPLSFVNSVIVKDSKKLPKLR